MRLLLTDCDGVLTDATVYCGTDGEALVGFSRRDGAGVARLRDAGIETGIVTRENSTIVARRAEKLTMTEVHLGIDDKRAAIERIAAARGLDLQQVAYIGDDVYDIDALQSVGLAACPADADPAVHAHVHVTLRNRGGRGAFRELADLILGAHPEEAADPRQLMVMGTTPKRWLRVGSRAIGEGEPVYVIAEIGINHNGSVDIARRLIDGAVAAGCDCVKFQKRTPELCVPPEQQNVERDTPWGRITYLEYRRRVELNFSEYAEIDRYCRERGIAWTASPWDEPSVEFLDAFDVPFLKAASAALTDRSLLSTMRATGRPLMLSTGMSTQDEIDTAVSALGTEQLLVAHSTSAYPCPPQELNLHMIHTLQDRFPCVPIGYSGHEVGLATTNAAVALGAAFVERHVTLDRSMWGSDQAASVEIVGLMRLVRDIRDIEKSLGDGVKRVYDSELGALRRLRRVRTPAPASQVANAV